MADPAGVTLPSGRPALLATDLDGTLLRGDFTVSDRTRRALARAAQAGVEVVFATGRPPRWLPDAYRTTGVRPVTICANGALTLRGEEAVHVRPISADVVRQVRKALRQTRADFVFRLETWRGQTLKLLASLPRLDDAAADAVLAQVQQTAGHLVEATHSAHGQLLIEMGASGVTKARALQEVRDEFWPGYTLVAIGDMPNDAAMLRAADLPVTVLGGHPSLTGIAQRVVPGPDQDGVAQLLEELSGSRVTWLTRP